MNDYLRLDEVVRLTGFSITVICNYNKKKGFPEKIKIDGRHVRWKRSEVEEWICRKKEEKSTYKQNVSICCHCGKDPSK